MQLTPTPKRKLVPRGFGRFSVAVLAGLAALLGATTPAPLAAQGRTSSEGVNLNNSVPQDVQNVTVSQNLGDRIPQDLELTDSRGRTVESAHYFDGEKPVIVTLNYSDCPMLCSVQLNALTQSLGQMDLQIGEDFRLLTVSIDPDEETKRIRKTKQSYIDQLPEHPGAEQGWAFCTADESTITRLADSLGFQYTYDEASGEYYHPAMLAFVSPEGVITRYSLQVNFPSDQLKLALIDAGQGNVGGPVDQFILWCYSYDPEKGSYVAQAWRIMQLGGIATVGLLLAALTPYWIGRKRVPGPSEPPAGSGEETAEDEAGSEPNSHRLGDGARK